MMIPDADIGGDGSGSGSGFGSKSNNIKELEADKIEYVTTIGRGHFAVCDVVRYKGVLYVLKRVTPTKENMSIEFYSREKRALECVMHHGSHPHVVQYFGFTVNSQNEQCYLLEKCETDIHKQYCATKREVDEKFLQMIFVQMLSGLAFLHSINIVHRDLKTDNLLLKTDELLMLADMGLSVEMPKNQHFMSSLHKRGHHWFTNPSELGEYTHSFDFYSMGRVILYLVLNCIKGNTFDEKDDYKYKSDFDNLQNISDDLRELLLELCDDKEHRIEYKGIVNHKWVQSKQLIQYIYSGDNIQKKDITLKDLYQIFKEKDEFSSEYIVFVSYYYDQDTLYLLEDTDRRHLYSVKTVSLFHINILKNCDKPTEHKEYQRLLTLYKTVLAEKNSLMAINMQKLLIPRPDSDVYKAADLLNYLSLLSSEVKATLLSTITSINIYDHYLEQSPLKVTPDIVESILMNNDCRALFKERYQKDMADYIVLVTDDKDQFSTLQSLQMKEIRSICMISLTINQKLKVKASDIYKQLVNVYSSLLNNNNKRSESDESNDIEAQERLQYLLPRVDSHMYNPYQLVYYLRVFVEQDKDEESVLSRPIAFSKYNDQLQVQSWDIHPKSIEELINQNYDYLKQYNMSISDYILLVSYTDTPDKRHLLSSNTKPIYKISTIHAYSIKNITLDDSPVIKSSEYEQLVDLYVSLLSERNDQLLTLIPEALCNMLLPKTHYKHYQPSNIIQYIHMLVSDEKLKSVIAQVNNVIPLSLYESYKEYKSIHQFSIMDYIAYLNHDYEQIKKNHSIEISNYLILGSIHEKPDSFFVLSYHSLFSMKSAYAFQITKVHDIIVPEYSPIHVALKGLYISLRKDKFSKIIGSMPQNIANIIAPPDSNIFKDKNMNIAYYINLIKSDSEIQTMINCMEEDLKGERNVHDLKIETLKRDLRNLNDYTAQNDKRISDITHEIHLLKNRNEAVKLRSSKEQVDINKQSLMNLKNSIDQLEKDRVESYEEMKIALSKGVKQKDDTELTKEEEKVEAVLLELSKKVDKLARELTDLEIKNQNNFNK